MFPSSDSWPSRACMSPCVRVAFARFTRGSKKERGRVRKKAVMFRCHRRDLEAATSRVYHPPRPLAARCPFLGSRAGCDTKSRVLRVSSVPRVYLIANREALDCCTMHCLYIKRTVWRTPPIKDSKRERERELDAVDSQGTRNPCLLELYLMQRWSWLYCCWVEVCTERNTILQQGAGRQAPRKYYRKLQQRVMW